MAILPHLSRDAILSAYGRAPGNEIAAGKFDSPESSAALVANGFGYFLDKPEAFPLLPFMEMGETVLDVAVERCLRFPWRGGLHPWLDAVIETNRSLIAFESKRYEPFRTKGRAGFSAAYERDWGPGMSPYVELREGLANGSMAFRKLDAVQLVKHAFGIATQSRRLGKRGVLVYLHAQPDRWPGGRPHTEDDMNVKQKKIVRFCRNLALQPQGHFVPIGLCAVADAHRRPGDPDQSRPRPPAPDC
jgi:hypothetical protein